jgi:hypothetical protein
MTDLIKHYRQLLGIAKGWATANLAGWCDDLHRDLLARHGAVEIEGRVSASSMNMPQLAAALDDYESRGWPRSRTFNSKGAQAPAKVTPQISQIVKLWGNLDKAGKLKNPSRAGMLGFCGHHVKREITKLDDLTTGECQGIIEALKAWSRR